MDLKAIVPLVLAPIILHSGSQAQGNHLPGDSLGLKVGLKAETDILGNKITRRPDMGAIELLD